MEKKLEPCHCGCPDLIQKLFNDGKKPNVMVICPLCDSHMTVSRWTSRVKYFQPTAAVATRIDFIINEANKAVRETWNDRMSIKEGVGAVRKSVTDLIEASDKGFDVSSVQWLKFTITLAGIMIKLSKELSKHIGPEDTEEVTFVPIPNSLIKKVGEGEEWN